MISITNKTMELKDCRDAWFYDSAFDCWCLEDILYTPKATVPKFQRLSIYAPAPYREESGALCYEKNCGGYTAKTAPIIFAGNAAGYLQMPHMWPAGPRSAIPGYLAAGFVVVTAGNRGRDSKDAKGNYVGRCPANLVDYKTAIRFIRHNRDEIPGDMDRIIVSGWSAGGAMSSLVSVSGDLPVYDPYLRENGAFMDESDAVYAAQIYCPIIDLEHASASYEWFFAADKENEASPAGPAGKMGSAEEALSRAMASRYIDYFNDLGLKHPQTGELLAIGKDGRSGSGYDYLLELLSDAVTDYLHRLAEGIPGKDYSAEDYLAGRYTYEKMAPMGPGGPGGPGGPNGPEGPGGPQADLLQGFAGQGVALPVDPGQSGDEPPTLGDMMSRPPKGEEPFVMEPPMITVQGEDKRDWITWDGDRAKISSLDDYVLHQRRRMKPCTAFDGCGIKPTGENEVFGDSRAFAVHFDEMLLACAKELADEYPEKFAPLMESLAFASSEEVQKRVAMYNPVGMVAKKENGQMAEHFRIRVGGNDADAPLTSSMTLACLLAQAGRDVDYAIVWEEPHGEADVPGEFAKWVRSITS